MRIVLVIIRATIDQAIPLVKIYGRYMSHSTPAPASSYALNCIQKLGCAVEPNAASQPIVCQIELLRAVDVRNDMQNSIS